MKKLSLLIVIAMLLSIGGVYATWTYVQNKDVADDSVGKQMNLTSVEYSNGYGVYEINHSDVVLTIDPLEGSAHTTGLLVSGNLVVTFTPSTNAPVEIKTGGVDSTFAISISSTGDWVYDDGNGEKPIITLNTDHGDGSGAHDVEWELQSNGTFTYTVTAAQIKEHLNLTPFVLDTKADYDAYNAVLRNGSIVFFNIFLITYNKRKSLIRWSILNFNQLIISFIRRCFNC